MLVKSASLKDVTWANIEERFGRDRFEIAFGKSNLIGFVNWTMIPYMSDIWESLLKDFCPRLTGARRRMFFDLADPQKRPDPDIQRALKLMREFQKYFDVTLGLNEKEETEIAEALGINSADHSPEGLANVGREIYGRL